MYAESLPYWDDILKMDSAYKLAHMAYGKVNYQLGNFGEAMEYFRKANDREQYSKAKEQYRKEFISQNFTIISYTNENIPNVQCTKRIFYTQPEELPVVRKCSKYL